VKGIEKFVQELMSHSGDSYTVKKALNYLFSVPKSVTEEEKK